MKKISELPAALGIGGVLPLDGCPVRLRGKNRMNILALGDVGATMLIGLRLLGSDVISSIGLCDIRQENCQRLEMEMNQIGFPDGAGEMPPVHIITEEALFECEVMVFCASRGVPPVQASSEEGAPGTKPAGDVRMAQLEANRDIIRHYARLARQANYQGMVCVVSDPVDHLAAAFLSASGLQSWQIQGFGLGVMNMRARYYAERHSDRFGQYLTEGRAYGPHGEDLVIADSLEHYDDACSRELTSLAVQANLAVRELGFKPYIAPALSSAALSILLTLRGEWHYSSVYLGDGSKGAFLGIRNRMGARGVEYEDAEMPTALFERILEAYEHLCLAAEGEEAHEEHGTEE